MLEKWNELDQKKKIIAVVAAIAAMLIIVLGGVFIFARPKEEAQEPQEEPKEPCPIDFASYKAINEEVYAYVEVPGTSISYPILHRAGDNEYYVNHQIDGTEGRPGVIYTEDIDSHEFTDNNTIVYGHNMRDGRMFHDLHMFEDQEFFDQEHVFYIYMPDKRLTYTVFAAACIDDQHLWSKYSFSTSNGNMNFIADLQKPDDEYDRYKEGTEIGGDDKLCTLFTCMPLDMPDNRYVVVGLLTDTVEYETETETE